MTDCISVLILTLNEEINLPECLHSIADFDDVIVLDSLSSDRTEEIATAAGAKFFSRAFDNYAAQRNYALQQLPFENDWILMLDADERVSAELACEMRGAVTACGDKISLFRMRRKDHFMGRWIRRSSGYPTWFGRLMRRSDVTVQRAINEEYTTCGGIGQLQHHLIHFPFNKGLSHWVEKHNRYSTMEAVFWAERCGDWRGALWKLLSTDAVIRRKAIKNIVYNLPGRPLWMFFALYFLRLGFFDGKPGLYFCLLRSFYEFLIDCKKVEISIATNNAKPN